MRFVSTSGSPAHYSLTEVIKSGLAPDGGLYMPSVIPEIKLDELLALKDADFVTLASRIMTPFLEEDLTEKEIADICRDSFSFTTPFTILEKGKIIMELFHGPTLAFKDYGARFLARLISQLHGKRDELTVLVATSGDTGGAVASGFFRVPGIRVVVLYPSGRVSPFQEKQFATLGENIYCLKVNGSFDDCQQLVKMAFNDTNLKKKIKLTSANSINIGRWVPQSIYYFHAYLKWIGLYNEHPPVFSVPSGNYGNLAAGILALKMGLKEARFIAASNINNVVPVYLRTGRYTPIRSVETVSNAMDVGDPSNFVRLKHLVKDDTELKRLITGYEFTDIETIKEIENTIKRYKYLVDPHTATGLLALEKGGEGGIVLGTAHPCKFSEVLPHGIRELATPPPTYNSPAGDKLLSVKIDARYDNLHNFLTGKT